MKNTKEPDYTNLKHKILQVNEEMIRYYLMKDYKNMSNAKLLLDIYIEKVLELKNKKSNE